MFGLLIKTSLFCFCLGFLGVVCQSTQLKLNPEGTEFVKQVNESFYVNCFHSEAKNVWWYQDNQNISDAFTRVHVERTPEKNTSEAALYFTSIQSSDAGNYTCRGTINNHTESASFFLRTYKPITFRDTPAAQSFWENETSVIRCEAEGEPQPALSWFIDGKHAEVYDQYQAIGDGLLIKNVTLEDEKREFICRAAAVNNITSNMAMKKIKLTVLYAPKVKGKKENEVYGLVGGNLTLTCQIDSNPHANFTWLRNNTAFYGDENTTIIEENNKSLLQISYINNSWFERYVCQASNEKGNVTIGFNVNKVSKPEPPKKAKVHSTTVNSLQLEIHPPPSKEQEITSYKVQIMERQDKEKGKQWEVAREVILLKDKPYIITDLKPNTEYVVRVTSLNKAGAGEYTHEIKTKTRSSAPSNYTLSTTLLVILLFFYMFNFV